MMAPAASWDGGERHAVRLVALYDYGELSQWRHRLEFIAHVGGLNFFAHRGEDAVIDDAGRVRPLRIEWATSESGFGCLLFIVGNLSGSQSAVHKIMIDRFGALSRPHPRND